MAEKAEVENIRCLNDELRRNFTNGQVFITRGIKGLDEVTIRAIVQAVAAFDVFTDDNDPHGEHDCATLTVEGVEILWKIDYYDLQLECHSPDAADPAVTRRVLTIMLVEEY